MGTGIVLGRAAGLMVALAGGVVIGGFPALSAGAAPGAAVAAAVRLASLRARQFGCPGRGVPAGRGGRRRPRSRRRVRCAASTAWWERFEDDIRALSVIALVADRLSKRVRIANLPGFVELFAQLVLEELDFRLEALNMTEIGLANEDAGLDHIRVPRPIPGLVTGRVHALLYGVFHGDLHAGNVLIDEAGNFSLVDFGIAGRLDATQRAALCRLVIGFARNAFAAQVAAVAEFGALPPDIDLEPLIRQFAEESTALLAAVDRPLNQLDFATLTAQVSRAIRLLAEHRFRQPTELVLFSKNLLYLNGLCNAFAPDINLLSEIAPVFLYFQQKYPKEIAAIMLGSFPPPG